jgi:Ca2+-binding EF-hand superfamily protein
MKSFVLLLSLGLASTAMAQGRGNSIRFQSMDTNGDGVITRAEWRGNDQSFRTHDWNGDGILSGDEVRIAARRPNTRDDRDVAGTMGRDEDWTPEHFRALDDDRDGRVSRSEWRASATLFARADRNRDGYLSLREFEGYADNEEQDRFAVLDTNRDGRITRAEWVGSAGVFDSLDVNRDGVLTRTEAVGTNQNQTRDDFRSADANGDGVVSRSEWHWNMAAFDRLDANHDGRLSRNEFETSPGTNPLDQSPTYRAGYERGHQEGIQAGREDKPRFWDLEGQTELETADSGYNPSIGPKAEYQAGYRAGFRRGYREGFGPR